MLFYSLLVTMVADPILSAIGWGDALIQLFLAANLLAAVTSVDLGVRRPILLTVLAGLVIARLAADWVEAPALALTTLAVLTMAGLAAAAGALRFALTARIVGIEHVYAALSAYLLLGLFFGLAYWAVDQLSPGSLGGASPHSLADAIYFSFVTLATLGYGDIIPRGEIARGLAVVEGIGGQLFLAVMVARLVSVYARKE